MVPDDEACARIRFQSNAAGGAHPRRRLQMSRKAGFVDSIRGSRGASAARRRRGESAGSASSTVRDFRNRLLVGCASPRVLSRDVRVILPAWLGARMVTIEARPYGADMTPEERDTLLSRVYVVEPGIVFYREIPVQTVESIDLMLGRMDELACEWPTFIEVLDLATVSRPSPAVRAAIRGWMLRIAPRMTQMCVIVEKNVVIRAVARFVGYSMNIRQVSFHETEAEAIDVARRLRA